MRNEKLITTLICMIALNTLFALVSCVAARPYQRSNPGAILSCKENWKIGCTELLEGKK